MGDVNNSQDVLDSRDIIERIEELEGEVDANEDLEEEDHRLALTDQSF